MVRGVQYPGENDLVWPDGVNVATTDTTYVYITFPGLTVTDLHPGDAITMVCLALASIFADMQSWVQLNGANGYYKYLQGLAKPLTS